ncbi:MAG: site-2 protease family protein [Clostridia bacterium]|nr:site-2 protease family protein [Clostridia bacterium]
MKGYEGVMNIVFTIIIAIAVFMLIILIHEFGHFVVAKSSGVLVHEFSIGFGPKLLKWKKGETEYSLRIFPVGGFVRLEGEDEDSKDPRALNNKPVGKRLAVMAAGAGFNVITGFLAMTIFFAMQPQYTTLEIGKVLDIPGSQAAQYLEVGDKIVSLDGKKVWNFNDFSFIMSNADVKNPVEVGIKRGGEKLVVEVQPVEYEGRYLLGIEMMRENMNLKNAIICGFNETFYMVRLVVYSLMMLVTGKVPVSAMSGPVGTTVLIGQAARQGLDWLIYMFALLSVNIGIFNVIPFPALDGGRIFFLLIEMIRRKPIPPEKEGMIHFVGLVILMLFMIFVTSSDIFKLFA